MKIILMRHYKVNLKFAPRYDSVGFTQVGIAYNRSDVFDQTPPDILVGKLYASTMKRAIKTAKLAFKQEPASLKGVHEVTMKSYKETSRTLPTWWWELMARIHWRLGYPTQYETYHQTIKRLDEAIDILIEQNEDATVVMHGLVMRYMARCLRRRGFRGPRILHAKNGQCYTFIKT